MAQLRNVERDAAWPAELATFDPDRHGSRAAWHLERAYAAHLYFDRYHAVVLEEIRASVGRPANP